MIAFMPVGQPPKTALGYATLAAGTLITIAETVLTGLRITWYVMLAAIEPGPKFRGSKKFARSKAAVVCVKPTFVAPKLKLAG